MFSNTASAISSLLGLAIDLIAVALAISRWNRHPVVSMLVLVATVLHLVVRGLYWVVPSVAHGLGASDLSLLYLGGALVSTAAGGLILAAVFVERPGPDASPDPDAPPEPGAPPPPPPPTAEG